MSQINVSNLTFGYDGSYDNVFENVSFSIDTDWKLGFIGRNGKGKTTFLNLLLGKYEYQGSISSKVLFDYFPYRVTEAQRKKCAADFYEALCPECEFWRLLVELAGLDLDTEVLYRPFETLSFGEQTKVMLALLFSVEDHFLLIDEPTNHLDAASRECVKKYLQRKKGFILVSHDRNLLDACIDHVLVLNRHTIQVEKGNFSSWWENKERRDKYEQTENEKHLKEIEKLNKAARQTMDWADKSERTKIGFDPVKEHDRSISARSYIGAKTKKMQSRVKQMENRLQNEVEQKKGLLKDVEAPVDLKLMPLSHHKEVYIRAEKFSLTYAQNSGQLTEKILLEGKQVLKEFDFELKRGERVLLRGKNGCGKSSFFKAVLQRQQGAGEPFGAGCSGILQVPSGLIISYINQDTSMLSGSLTEFAKNNHMEEYLLKAVLRQLDFGREQFDKNIEEFSQGQKKKVLIAASLLKQAHLYIWDEPLNYVDVFSRIQIENLILKYQPTMLFAEHDVTFGEKIATRVVDM